MHEEEASERHNPVVHELSVVCWLVSTCLERDECWSTPEERAHVLRCCGEVMASVGALADQVCGQDQEVTSEVRMLTDLLTRRSEQLGAADG